MSPSHKVDERALKNIINNNVIPSDDNTDINLVIYYKNRRTSNLFMKNNMNSPTDSLQRTCIVAVILCNTGIALLAYMDGVAQTPTLGSVVMAAAGAACSAVYKLTKKKEIYKTYWGRPLTIRLLKYASLDKIRNL
ncbi:hypothetical protein FJT64_022684 [Amphibalanus amphitrite]|uniref:Uncharacterized protein n=1 Tax=Amphibalanus amphitrite TaxID=1232801 RepID=A0A6A4WPT2_AMPAM|nr:hypothetical protein FJT64_022684 [Amphibalanus amphitrite]